MASKLVYNPPPPEPNINRLSEYSALAPAFAVDQILPICSLTAILATPGAGKTTLATMLAAATDAPYHLDTDHPTVLMVSPFANAQLEIRPRLVQLGTNLDRVRVMDYLYMPEARTTPRRAYSIHDLPIIASELTEYASYRLLVIDCAEMFFDLPSRPNRKRVLEQLYKLIDLANTYEISVVIMLTVSQLRQNPFASTFLSAVAEASRTSYILDRDAAGRRTLYPHKNVLDFLAKSYLIADLPTQASTCAPSPLPTSSEPQTQSEQPNMTLHPEVLAVQRNRALFQLHPDQLPFASRHMQDRQKPGPKPFARDFACEVLLDALSKGPRPVGDKDDPSPRSLMHELKLANVTFGTAMRAKRLLNIEAYKKRRQWFWRLLPNPAGLPAAPEAHTTPSPICAPSPAPQDSASPQPPQPGTETQDSSVPPSEAHPTPAPACAPSPTADGPDSPIENQNPDPSSEAHPSPSQTSAPSPNPETPNPPNQKSEIKNQKSELPPSPDSHDKP